MILGHHDINTLEKEKEKESDINPHFDFFPEFPLEKAP